MLPSPTNPTEGENVQTLMPTLTGWEDDISIKDSPAAADGLRNSKAGSDWPEYINDGSWEEGTAESTEKTEGEEERGKKSASLPPGKYNQFDILHNTESVFSNIYYGTHGFGFGRKTSLGSTTL